jgi:hypothetical protein
MTSRKNSKKEGGRRKHRATKRKSHSRRHTHKGKHGTPSWPQFVKKTYLEMKRSNPSATFRDAMVKASKLKKEGKYHM